MAKATSKATRPSAAHSASRASGSRIGVVIASAHRNSVWTAESLPPEYPTHGGEILGYQSMHRDGISLRFYTSGVPNWVCADYVDSSKKPIPKPKFVTIVQLGSPLFPFQVGKYGGVQPASLVRPVSNEMHGFQFEGGDRMHQAS
ncbi:hypothetical protein BDZ89DRAFT_1124395 [Hymenopellis radicata]|nr:hypothetical protein BDZ89DRAFT_1124395 [Hymenopellis radicata]